ncbi:MAG: hypothetical protein RQ763_05915 [Sulfurimonas sp.]|uniref:hypothetical protein n=1 Tax=Sulfurimonas sp. TaxID=2022749 RepID=UPI0028CC82AA|nr:hypothetical protein [Sulfurimonas sp.]MDT8338713.1 hypothetical protein [Sulfurimonas sp.]
MWINFCLKTDMTKYLLIIATLFLFSACVNKHGISAKYYSDCKEYYDLQGYYHKECGEDDIITYKELGKKTDEAMEYVVGAEEEKPKGNVW